MKKKVGELLEILGKIISKIIYYLNINPNLRYEYKNKFLNVYQKFTYEEQIDSYNHFKKYFYNSSFLANNKIRDEIVPINKKYPLDMLMKSCLNYVEKAPRDFITFEYVMLENVNDSIDQAKELVNLIKNVPSKINLIPFNPFPKSGYKCSKKTTIKAFQEILMDAGIVTTIRKTRGDDIDAACGQLAGQVQDKTKRTQRLQLI